MLCKLFVGKATNVGCRIVVKLLGVLVYVPQLVTGHLLTD